MAFIRARQSSLSSCVNSDTAAGPYLLAVSMCFLHSHLTRILQTYLLNRVDMLPGRKRGCKPSAPGKVFQPGILSSVGEPQSSQIISSWWASLLPARIGFPVSISPKTQLCLSANKFRDTGLSQSQTHTQHPIRQLLLCTALIAAEAPVGGTSV